MLKFIGWYVTDCGRKPDCYGILMYQSTRVTKNAEVYEDMVATLGRLGVLGSISTNKHSHCQCIYVRKSEFTKWVYDSMPDRILTFDFISSLSQRQANVVLIAMLQGDGTGVNSKGEPIPNKSVVLIGRTKQATDAIQYLCTVAGRTTNYHHVTVEEALRRSAGSRKKQYAST